MTRQSRSVCLFLAMFFAVLILAAPGAFAQTAQGRISGQVTDSTGAAVPNATINIENIATHVSRTLQTNSTGDYAAPSIDPGVYALTVEASGFTKLVRERVQIEVGNDLKIDFHLKIGSINETVEVKDESGTVIAEVEKLLHIRRKDQPTTPTLPPRAGPSSL